MEVVLHYRSQQDNLLELQAIVGQVLRAFRTRPVSRFRPWFPYNEQQLPLKPVKWPPTISCEEAGRIQQLFRTSEPLLASQSYDCTEYLQEFLPNTSCVHTEENLLEFLPDVGRKALDRAQSVDVNVLSGPSEEGLLRKQKSFRHSWSVSGPGQSLGGTAITLSKELQTNLELFELHPFCRARWTIEQLNCSSQILEDVWTRLSSAIKHKELPTCNAKIDGDLSQIWVFCDLLYCEYVGKLLKQKLSLAGKINLSVHKHGVIFSM
ncbi:shieldin complex subunit 3 [Latimeria chalumnae]|nr:PREDICTED: uncharacterized protein LOC106703783 [Latimeria chalumnae]|eukprot:XP_014344764.1 PREDICTED: uncharacterized protein LOC106703783 [Latimeria chalumnae]